LNGTGGTFSSRKNSFIPDNFVIRKNFVILSEAKDLLFAATAQ
jgi:hypothetical protein